MRCTKASRYKSYFLSLANLPLYVQFKIWLSNLRNRPQRIEIDFQIEASLAFGQFSMTGSQLRCQLIVDHHHASLPGQYLQWSSYNNRLLAFTNTSVEVRGFNGSVSKSYSRLSNSMFNVNICTLALKLNVNLSLFLLIFGFLTIQDK